MLLRDSTHHLTSIEVGVAHGYAALRGTIGNYGSATYVAPMDSLGAVRPLVQGGGRNQTPSISADGRLLAWASSESGPPELSVQPIPGPGARVQVSVGGGTEPLWSRTGSTLFCCGPISVMAADMDGASLKVIRRDSLFADAFVHSPGDRSWDAFPGGEEFLMMRPSRHDVRNVILVMNWPQMKAMGGSAVSTRNP